MKLENTSDICIFLSLDISCLGVLPLWVIPAKALGTAPSAPADDNLKYLLAFAGAHLFVLFDLFFHCLPLVILSFSCMESLLQLAAYLAMFFFTFSQRHINM